MDSNADPSTGYTGIIRIGAGEVDVTWDAGLYGIPTPTGSIGDYVWNDANRDGRQDATEQPIAGVRLRLWDTYGNFIAWATTDGNGIYNFPDLYPGRYTVDVDETSLPAGFTLTTANEPYPVNLGNGEHYRQADFGYAPVPNPNPGSIGDFVWKDTNLNGIEDDGEFGIPNITVYLLNALRQVIATTSTDPDGYYIFKNLPPGMYFVVADSGDPDMPANLFLTTHQDTIEVVLHEDENYLEADFGYGENNWGKGRRVVLARYQPWYGNLQHPNAALRHWTRSFMGGIADTSLLDSYDSYDHRVLEYQILLAWAAGIDGFVVDWYGRNTYEDTGLMHVLDEADRLNRLYENRGFRFEIIASYNEMSTGRLDSNFAYLKKTILPHRAYWGNERKLRRPLFIYDVETAVLKPSQYRACADTVLPPDVFLVWNGTEPEALRTMDAAYPWVQPLNGRWDPKGKEWGETYLDTTYWRMNNPPGPGRLMFAVGGTWPGYDDRKYIDGKNRWMDRQDTLVYDKTWQKALDYSLPLSMPWCLVETWNDYNLGTSVEPNSDKCYVFVRMTRDRAMRFKFPLGTDSAAIDNLGLLVPQHVYQTRVASSLNAARAAELQARIDLAIDAFFGRRSLEAISLADDAVPLAPSAVAATLNSGTSIKVEWQPVAGAKGYAVFVSQDSNAFRACSAIRPSVLIAGNVKTFTVGGLTPNSVYYLAVTGVDSALGTYANDSWYENALTKAVVLRLATLGANPSMQPAQENPNTSPASEGSLPKAFALYPSYPNPFNSYTTIPFDLPEAQHVTLQVYDMMGRTVAVLVNKPMAAGHHRVSFNADNMASGLYFYRITTERFTAVRRFTLIR